MGTILPVVSALALTWFIRYIYYYHWVDTSAGWLLAPEGTILPVVSALALTWFIRYIYYYHWVDTSAGWPLAPEGTILPVVSALALIWFIRYIYYWNLQFLNNVITDQTKILFPRALVTVAGLG